MNTLSLFKMPFSEFQLKDTVSMALQQSIKSPLIDKFSIENQLYNAVKNNIQGQLKNLELNQDCPTCPPQNGLRTHFMVTLQVKLDYRVSFKAGIHAGLEFGNQWSSINPSAHLSLYNSGLGTPIYDNNKEKRKIVIDATVALNCMIGSSKGGGLPMNQYVINYDTPIPTQNTFSDWSVGYGQALTWNSAINKKFDFKDIQRQGIVNLRIGNFGLSTNNDTDKFPYFGGSTDYGWTGGIILSFAVANFGVIEAGHQTFTGKYDETNEIEKRRKELAQQIEDIEKNKTLSKSEKEHKLKILKDELREFLRNNPLHTQDAIQKKYNKAINFGRIYRDGNFILFEVETGGYMQETIHQKGIKIGKYNIYEPVLDLNFDYSEIRSMDNKPKIWIGKSVLY